ncbi:hypothetical protein DM02DRAFT_658555 [Periconia macrospinosa]|uniref:Zn(2)-C6 fungal-type domain-containing protein n=1 Tax=Periconia macrospinosa TaxID=97972 RepID=A0A2V1DIP0_9PLEO|nr:hypothetical protein DM02DRAFT_658555 [Periconia macrospinosa]
MSTKFRSACDRCHDAKVRCSGDMPCQGCILSKSLCFYSVSNVLGRPRGTKNKTSRRRTASTTTSDAKSIPNSRDQPATQKTTSRRRKTKDNWSPPDAIDIALPDCEDIDVQTILDSTIQTPTDNIWFFPGDTRASDSMATSDFSFDYFTPAESTTPVLGQTSPPLPNHFDVTLDLSMSDFATGEETSDNATFQWEDITHSQETLKTATEAAASIPSPPKSDTFSTNISTPNTCTCLRQQAELLSNPLIAEINACNSNDSALSLDKILSLSKQGFKAWCNLIACPICSTNNDQEAMLLALMSIRPVARYLQRVAPCYTERPRADSGTSTSKDTASIPHSKEPCKLMVGSHEIDDDERIFVYLQGKKKQELLELTSGRTAGVDDYHASSSLSHTQQITHSLATLLQDLESSFDTT